eukprot:90868_1
MKRLISTDRNLVQRAQSFYKRYACNQYPWSAKYPWIIGRNKQDEIQSLTYVLDESDALQTETYQTVLSLPTHNAVADHQIYEENEPHYGYGKIMYRSNINDINDSLFENPAFVALKSKKYSKVLPVYAGGGVTLQMKYIINAINAKCGSDEFKNKLNSKSMCIYAFIIDPSIHPSSEGVRKHTNTIKNHLLQNRDIVISSVYRVPLTTSLGSVTGIITCLTTFSYNDFLPNGSANICYSSAGDRSVRGLWQCVVYKDSHTDNISTVAINIYPASISHISSLKNGEFNNSLYVETMGNVTNACRGLLLAQKLNFESVVIGQPLAVAQLLFLYKYEYGLVLPHKISIVVGGYLCSNKLFEFITKYICDGEGIKMNWISYYGTTDFMAACLVTSDNQCNGFGTSSNEVIPSKCKRTNTLQLTSIHSNGSKTTIKTNDLVQKVDDRYYIAPKTKLENWIVNHWNADEWFYFTGNGIILNDILYLQCRKTDIECIQITFEKQFIPTTARTIKLLSFDQFEANFNSNIFQTKPKYLYSNGNDGNKVQSDVSFVQLSPSNSQRNCREFDNECEI